jgi:hypothetical protein
LINRYLLAAAMCAAMFLSGATTASAGSTNIQFTNLFMTAMSIEMRAALVYTREQNRKWRVGHCLMRLTARERSSQGFVHSNAILWEHTLVLVERDSDRPPIQFKFAHDHR